MRWWALIFDLETVNFGVGSGVTRVMRCNPTLATFNLKEESLTCISIKPR